MRGMWIGLLLTMATGCGNKVVKSEGFAGSIVQATNASMMGKVGALGAPSCGQVTPTRRVIKLVEPSFLLNLLEESDSGDPRLVTAEIEGERFTNEKAGTSTELVVDSINGRIIGALTAELAHHTVGTMIEREDGQMVPAPMNKVSLKVNFNLQPCP